MLKTRFAPTKSCKTAYTTSCYSSKESHTITWLRDIIFKNQNKEDVRYLYMRAIDGLDESVDSRYCTNLA